MASSLVESDADVRAARPRVHQHRLAQQLVGPATVVTDSPLVSGIPVRELPDTPSTNILDREVEHAGEGQRPELAGLDVELGDADQFALHDHVP